MFWKLIADFCIARSKLSLSALYKIIPKKKCLKPCKYNPPELDDQYWYLNRPTRCGPGRPKPPKGPPAILPLLAGGILGFGIVNYLNSRKTKTRKYICYHPPPPYLETEPPPNCCRPTIVEIVDQKKCNKNDVVTEKKIKSCKVIKILDPCNIHDHDPCKPACEPPNK